MMHAGDTAMRWTLQRVQLQGRRWVGIVVAQAQRASVRTSASQASLLIGRIHISWGGGRGERPDHHHDHRFCADFLHLHATSISSARVGRRRRIMAVSGRMMEADDKTRRWGGEKRERRCGCASTCASGLPRFALAGLLDGGAVQDTYRRTRTAGMAQLRLSCESE